jgi:hypothetical protein
MRENPAPGVLAQSLPGWRRPALRHALNLVDVITLVGQEAQQVLVIRLRPAGRAHHDPDVIALVATDDRLGVLRIEIDDAEVGLERPDELHAPDGVAFAIAHEAGRRVHLAFAIETALTESERRGHRALVG